MIVQTLMLKDISRRESTLTRRLFADGLGLDSIDALELAVEIGRRYKVQIKSDDERNREIFRSVRTLAAFIAEEKARRPASRRPRAMTRDEIFARVRELLTKTFGLPAEKVTPTALLQQDLDLDSIDAVNLVVYLQDWTGREVPEEALRAVRTVDDVVSMVETHLAGGPAPGATAPGANKTATVDGDAGR